ncbi:hypothetical protein SUDANB176_00250 [Streptomyces sp. enrichment culture]
MLVVTPRRHKNGRTRLAGSQCLDRLGPVAPIAGTGRGGEYPSPTTFDRLATSAGFVSCAGEQCGQHGHAVSECLVRQGARGDERGESVRAGRPSGRPCRDGGSDGRRVGGARAAAASGRRPVPPVARSPTGDQRDHSPAGHRGAVAGAARTLRPVRARVGPCPGSGTDPSGPARPSAVERRCQRQRRTLAVLSQSRRLAALWRASVSGASMVCRSRSAMVVPFWVWFLTSGVGQVYWGRGSGGRNGRLTGAVCRAEPMARRQPAVPVKRSIDSRIICSPGKARPPP